MVVCDSLKVKYPHVSLFRLKRRGSCIFIYVINNNFKKCWSSYDKLDTIYYVGACIAESFTSNRNVTSIDSVSKHIGQNIDQVLTVGFYNKSKHVKELV